MAAMPVKKKLHKLLSVMPTATNSSSVLGNLASVDVNVKISPLTILYLFLLIVLGATSVFLVDKYI